MEFVVPVEMTDDPEKPIICNFPGCQMVATHFVWLHETNKHPHCKKHTERLIGVARASGNEIHSREILALLDRELP